MKRRTYIGGFSEFFGGSPTLIATTSDFNGTADFDDFSPRVSLAYDVTGQSNIYFTYAQGFKGGSFDPRGQTTAAPDLNQNCVGATLDPADPPAYCTSGVTIESDPDDIYEFMQFDPEQVDSYEVGYKASHFGGDLTYSLAAFYGDYKDVQVPGSVGVDTDGDGVAETFTGVTTNAGAATIKGVEFEGSAILGDDVFRSGDLFNASWSVGYIDAQYDTFIDATGTNVADQRVFQNTPEWTASLRLAYDTPLTIASNNGNLLVNTLVSYRGESSQFEVRNPFLDQPAFTLWDASVRWEAESGNWGVSLTGKNLTDERYVVAGYDFVNTPSPLGLEGTLTGFYGDPRTVTLGLDFEF